MGTETRQLGAHPNLIFDVIQKQAGSLGKAVLEGIQNSIDAEATQVTITLDEQHLRIDDDGRGIQTRADIEAFFETFGTPHEEGDATFGRFRIGRGQLFSFGVNDWRTGTFHLHVDVKNDGLAYTLTEHQEAVGGTRVDVALYDPMLPSDLDSAVREVSELARYVPVPVVLNGERINKVPADQNWTLITEDAYIHIANTTSLSVYNQGVKVRDYPAHDFGGVGGALVSRVPLAVNFARNDVLRSQCPVFQRLVPYLKEYGVTEAKKKTSLSASEREAFGRQVVGGEIDYDEARTLRLVTDVRNKHHPLRRIIEAIDTVVVAPTHRHLVGDKIHQTGEAFVLSPHTLDRFGVADLDGLKTVLDRLCPSGVGMTIGDFNGFAVAFDEFHEVLPDKQLTKREKAALNAVRDGVDSLAKGYRKILGAAIGNHRQVYAGSSDASDAWTDGANFIAIERSRLKLAQEGIAGFVALAGLVAHELTHDQGTNGSHDHSPEFYETFHEIALPGSFNGKPTTADLGDAAQAMVRRYTKELRKKGERVTQVPAKDEDADAVMGQLALLD